MTTVFVLTSLEDGTQHPLGIFTSRDKLDQYIRDLVKTWGEDLFLRVYSMDMDLPTTADRGFDRAWDHACPRRKTCKLALSSWCLKCYAGKLDIPIMTTIAEITKMNLFEPSEDLRGRIRQVLENEYPVTSFDYAMDVNSITVIVRLHDQAEHKFVFARTIKL